MLSVCIACVGVLLCPQDSFPADDSISVLQFQCVLSSVLPC